MALASVEKVVLGSIAFVVFWVLAVFPAVPLLPIGRTAGAILGAMLMVLFQVITPQQAYSAIDLSVLGLLFGTMVVSIYLERADMFKYLGALFSWKSRGPKDLLCRICIVSALSSALFTNDTTCVILTEFILKTARQNNIPPHPFLLALASSANIGSSATPIGNPQNLIIAIQSHIPFVQFLMGILPAMLVGIVVNASILLCMYWRVLSGVKGEKNALPEVVSDEEAGVNQFPPVPTSPLPSLKSKECNPNSESMDSKSPPNKIEDGGHPKIVKIGTTETDKCRSPSGEVELKKSINVSKEKASSDAASSQIVEEMEEKFAKGGKKEEKFPNGGAQGNLEMMNDIESGLKQPAEERKNCLERWKSRSWKACVYLVSVGMLVAFLMGLNMSWTALTAALIFVVLDFKDAGPCLDRVSYSLLVFFCGMFITVYGFNKTGIPGTLWNQMEPHARINHASGVAVLAIVILLLSNIASNVPTVLLLGARVAASAAAISSAHAKMSEIKKAWLILAWVSTVAGNLSLLGSAANLIVCEQARRAQTGYTLSFWRHLKFGLPSTLIITAIGLTLIRG